MKNKLIIAMLALGTLATSCTDAYDIVQKGEVNVDTDAFRTAADIVSGLNTVYSSIPVGTEIEFNSVFTDEIAIGLENGGQGLLRGEYNFFMEPGSSYASNLWGSYYLMINRLNRLEATAIKLLDATTNQNEKLDFKNALAEIYVLRAYAHYKLFSYFTPDYKNDKGESIIILDHVPPADYSYSLPRNNVKDVVDFIMADLKKATDSRSSWGTSSYYVNLNMINAIRAKLYAMVAKTPSDWQKVVDYSKDALIGKRAIGQSEYQEMFKRDGSMGEFDESIFVMKSTLNTGPRPVSTWYTVRASSDGSPIYEMGRSLYNELDNLDKGAPVGEYDFSKARNDVRYTVNLLPSGVFPDNKGTKVLLNYDTAPVSQYKGEDVLLIGKFRGLVGNNLANDVPLIRASDILLTMAEAMVELNQPLGTVPVAIDPDDIVGNYSSVYNVLYTIRHQRSIDYSKINLVAPVSKQDAFNMILKERRVELAFEGHRYLDMKRLGAKAGSEGFVRYSRDCEGLVSCSLPVTSHKMTLPIPQVELNGNSKINSADQNPGY
ncbi:RagB/SusD family nutrient uptake outer membrane protein [Capnocytophaga sp. ARDL2]|uniref:RagB/SusD family nutrient uptake outer membrane protein n=1 Tax=Capnocytophaga sp. ARDL2 TaxID=3238809 RepID=UPI003557F3D7